MTSPRAARLAAAAAVALAVVVVLPGRHAALAAPNDYASDSSSVPDGDGSPLPVANIGIFDRAANYASSPPSKPYPFLDRVPVTEAAFLEFTNFITAHIKADIDFALLSMINAAESISGSSPNTSEKQKESLKNDLERLIDMARPGDMLYGVAHPTNYERRTVAYWIYHFAIAHCGDARRRLTGAQSLDSPYFGEYYVHRDYLKDLRKTVVAVQSVAVNFAEKARENVPVVQHNEYIKHSGNLDSFLAKAGSLATVLKNAKDDSNLKNLLASFGEP